MKIDKNIPIPAKKHGGGTYGFSLLEVGDSMFFAGLDHESKVASAARKWTARHDSKLTCRREGDGIRIWRIE